MDVEFKYSSHGWMDVEMVIESCPITAPAVNTHK